MQMHITCKRLRLRNVKAYRTRSRPLLADAAPVGVVCRLAPHRPISLQSLHVVAAQDFEDTSLEMHGCRTGNHLETSQRPLR